MNSEYLQLAGVCLYIIGVSIHAVMPPTSLWRILVGVVLPPVEWYRSTRELIKRTGAYSWLAIVCSIVAVYFALAWVVELPVVGSNPKFRWCFWLGLFLWFLCPVLTISRYVYRLLNKSPR
jgi:hypothetical protein